MVYAAGWKKAMIVAAMAVACHLFTPADAGSAPKPRETAKTAIAEKAPDFVLTDLNGRKYRLSDFRGKQPVLIIFSTTWCLSCREEIPHFKSLHATYAKRGLEIVNIDIQESKEKVAKFTVRYGLPYRVVLDEEGDVGGIYDIRGVPSMVLIDKNGNILCRQCPKIEAILETILKKR
ncbi:MAG: TlpA family protein disulfide reductase [Proteobacteria bacterium]|nr:TlpA family protein disulfide reductase [Pseudomonadota bacterium]